MVYQDKKDKIKQALRSGGLVISERNSGKTMALLELVMEDRNSVLLVHNQAMFDRCRAILRKWGYSENTIKECVQNSTSYLRRFSSPCLEVRKDFRVYVDEYYLNPYRGPFVAAATTFPAPITFV